MSQSMVRPSLQKTQLRGILRWLVKTLIGVLILGLALFLAAGQTDWPAGWRYVAVLVLVQVINAMVLIPLRPDLIIERSQTSPDARTWDLWLAAGMALIGPVAMMVSAGLAFRFGQAAGFDESMTVVGLALVLVSSLIVVWAMLANPFFLGTIRIQTERGHRVASSGPYGVIRHPGYASIILFDLATPLALGSVWAFIPALLTIVVVFVRTMLEDRTLQNELPGYKEYAQRVRSRLIPGIW